MRWGGGRLAAIVSMKEMVEADLETKLRWAVSVPPPPHPPTNEGQSATNMSQCLEL